MTEENNIEQEDVAQIKKRLISNNDDFSDDKIEAIAKAEYLISQREYREELERIKKDIKKKNFDLSPDEIDVAVRLQYEFIKKNLRRIENSITKNIPDIPEDEIKRLAKEFLKREENLRVANPMLSDDDIAKQTITDYLFVKSTHKWAGIGNDGVHSNKQTAHTSWVSAPRTSQTPNKKNTASALSDARVSSNIKAETLSDDNAVNSEKKDEKPPTTVQKVSNVVLNTSSEMPMPTGWAFPS